MKHQNYRLMCYKQTNTLQTMLWYDNITLQYVFISDNVRCVLLLTYQTFKCRQIDLIFR